MYRMAQLCQLCRSDRRSSVGIDKACCKTFNGPADMHPIPRCPVDLGRVVLPRVRATIGHRFVTKRYRASRYQAGSHFCLRSSAKRYSFDCDSATQARSGPGLQTERAVSACAALRLSCAVGQLKRARPYQHVNAGLGHSNQANPLRSRAQLFLKPQAVLYLPKHRELKRLPVHQHPIHSKAQPAPHKPVERHLPQSRHQRQQQKRHQRRSPATTQRQTLHKLPSRALTSQQSLRLQILLVQKLLSRRWQAMLMSCSTRPTLAKTTTSSTGCSCWKKAMLIIGCGADGDGLVMTDRPNCKGPSMLLLATRSSRKSLGAAVLFKL